VTPSGVSGNYVWSFTGPFTQHSSSQDNSFRSIFWTQPGTYAATVTYSGSGFSVSSTVNIQVRVPTLTSFSGTASNTVVNRGSNCGNIFNGQHLLFGTTVLMGCSILQDGMVYSARRPSVRSYSVQQTNQYSLCQGAPDVTNPIDGSRFFTQQLYLDVLHRNPDEIGWNNWTTTIASCGFDGACIYNMRIHTARGFLESSENFANNPLLTSPDSHIRNREYVRLCYVSFLGRPPDQTGWNNWTDYLDSNPGGYNHVVGGFIYSWEYRGRFGNP
jgi:hypothetical protein